ncbi:hypothetical protein D918_01822 [Trichuris suis]|nr:hypothetical protein D918_01822 [Trichuris suis]
MTLKNGGKRRPNLMKYPVELLNSSNHERVNEYSTSRECQELLNSQKVLVTIAITNVQFRPAIDKS